MLSLLVQPRQVLEIGTFLGYSAICLAAGIQEGGYLHTIELREEEARAAEENFRRARALDKIILHRGKALDIIPTLDHVWDMVFIDADKTNYQAYYRTIIPRVRKGGLIIADNVLFHGEVLQKEIRGKNAQAIQDFNEYVRLDQSVESLLLPIRDGLMLIRKK